MPAIFTVDSRSGIPIYLQVIDQVKRAVALGTLIPGEQLPTVKALALELTINPNTVARAYRDLERDGVIATSPGRGSFVRASSDGEARRAHDDVASATLDAAVREAKALGLSREQVRALFERAAARWFDSQEER